MKVEYKNGKQFADIVKVLYEYVDIGVFKFTEEGMEITTMDPSRVALLHINIPRDDWDVYDVPETEEIGVELKLLKKILSRVKKKDSIIFETKGDNILYVTIKGSAKRTFKLGIIDTDTENVPDINGINIPFTTRAVVLGSVLKDMIRDSKLVSDSVTFKSIKDEEKLVMSSIGEVNEYYNELTLSDEGLLELEVEEDTKSSFGLNYIESALKGVNNTDAVTLKFANDAPIEISFDVGVNGKTLFLIAPRIE